MKNITVYRDDHSQLSTTISNHVINDRNLSYQARFLLIWLLSLSSSEATKLNVELLSRKIGMPLSRVRTCVQELQDTGYLKLERTRNGARFGNNVWFINETPAKE